MFRISILKMRLDRHKINAPQKYAKLDQKLKADPRLRVTSDWYILTGIFLKLCNKSVTCDFFEKSYVSSDMLYFFSVGGRYVH